MLSIHFRLQYSEMLNDCHSPLGGNEIKLKTCCACLTVCQSNSFFCLFCFFLTNGTLLQGKCQRAETTSKHCHRKIKQGQFSPTRPFYLLNLPPNNKSHAYMTQLMRSLGSLQRSYFTITLNLWQLGVFVNTLHKCAVTLRCERPNSDSCIC